MTTTSEHEAFIRFDTTLFDALDGVDTGITRIIRNNLNHAADSHGQTLINWHKRSTIDSASAFDIAGPITDYRHCWTSGRRPIRLRSDGSPYKFRVQVGGYRISGAGTTDFRVAMTTGDEPLRWFDDITAMGSNVATCSISSGTPAWMTLSSTILDLDAARLNLFGDAVRNRQTNDGTSSASASVPVTYVRMTVWATGVSGGVTGAYCAEYSGG